MPTRIQIRRGTSAQWAATNPVLAAGEEGLDTTTGDRRMGDGTTAWASLRKGPVGKGDLVFNVEDYGATGNGTTDDTAAINATITAAPAGSVIYFPVGTYKITSPIAVTKQLQLLGASRNGSVITAYACNGIEITTALTGVQVESLMVVSSVLYTTTTNTLIGIKVNGSSGSAPGYDVFRDLWVQGFRTAIETNYLAGSLFDGIYTQNGLLGLDVYGTSINNVLANSQIIVGTGNGIRLTGSKAVALNGQVSSSNSTAVQGEGWIITGNVLFGGDYCVDIIGTACCNVSSNILDYAHVAAVRTIHNGTAYSSDHDISGNYIAMAADAVPAGAGAVEIANTVGSGSTLRGVRVSHNDFISYGTAAPYGVHTIANQASVATITDNTFGGFQTYDVYMQSTSNICTGNRATNVAIYNYYSAPGASNLVANNFGNVFLDATAGFPNVYVQVGNNKLMAAAAAPTASSWARGDRVQHSAPAVGSPKAWTCTVAGTPGTWVSEGNL